MRKRVLTVAFEKQSEGDTTWALGGGRSGGVGAGGYFAPHIRAYIERSKAPEYVGWMVAVKDRRNALKNPYAHLKLPDIDLEMVRDSPMVWEPVRRLESCPASDGACAMVLTDEAGGDAATKPVAWLHGTAVRSELGQFPGRDPVNPKGGQDCAADVYRQAGITNPLEDVDVVECYVPFSWYEPMWMENLGFAGAGEGWKLTEDGETEIGGQAAGEPVGRRAVVEPDRRLRHAALRGGRAAGARPGRRAPGRRRPHGGRPRLRRRGPVLRHVGPAGHEAVSRKP